MRKGEDIRDEISFNGVDGLKSPQLIRAIRSKAFSENRNEDDKYMAVLASLCFDGPALEWFELLDSDVQTEWTLLRRALLARFPINQDTGYRTVIFTGDNPKECEDFVRSVRTHSHAEGKSRDDEWTAHYAASCMSGDALRWHARLDAPARDSWIRLERALLAYFPEPPPYGLTPAGRVLVERWERIDAPSFIPTDRETWLRQARERRKAYDEVGPGGLPSVHWVLVEYGENIPDAAIQTGEDTYGDPLFSARAWHEGGLHPGKIGRHLEAPHIEFGGEELFFPQACEVLVGDRSAVRWVSSPYTPEGAKSAPNIEMKAFHAVEGGRRADGAALLLTHAYREGCGWQPGKVGTWWHGCAIGWSGESHIIPNFRILVWAE